MTEFYPIRWFPPPTSIQQSILITTNLGTPTGLIPVPSEADSLQVPTRINHIIQRLRQMTRFDNSTNYSIRQWMKQWTRSNYSLESSNSIQCNNRTDEFNLNLSRVSQQSIREIDNQHISELDPHPYDNTSAKMNPSFHRASTRLGDGAHHQINRWKWPNREQ